MESESEQPQTPPEQPAFSREGYSEKLPLNSPERVPLGGGERYEQRAESAAGDVSSPGLPPPLPLVPVTQTPIATINPVTTDINDSPPIANDDDLIEKEWVDRAKKIIVETKDDPYRREEEVSRLQRDYLEKRYGRRIGLVGDGE